MNIRHLAAAAAAAVAAAALSTGAHADFGRDHRSAAVEIADLNLVRPGDAAILHERIVEAAWGICARPRPRTVLEGADRQRCFRGAVQRAVDRLDQPTLTLAHRQRFAWADRPTRRPIRLARA